MPNISNGEERVSDGKLTESVLRKFGIAALNPMQEDAGRSIRLKSDVVLLSPTGTGKTLAFLLPLVSALDRDCAEIQMLVLVPSRELAQQIEQVTRKMGSGFKVNAVYGGRAGALDKIDLKHRPAILIGTPGRIADRIRRDRFPLERIHTLILDEFDKSLEIGFKDEMSEIVKALPNVKQRILTSATSDAEIPEFVGLLKPVCINYLQEGDSQLAIKTLLTPEKDKLKSLEKVLAFIGNQPGIIFCNYREAVNRVSEFLTDCQIRHECFHGGMDQIDRERSLIKFRNGTNQLLLATDLAARGLDIPEIEFILHYSLPSHHKEFIHRNGRTARMNSDGIAYVLHWKDQELPDFIRETNPEDLIIGDQQRTVNRSPDSWKTLYIKGGRRDKISKGDIVGLFLKQGGIRKDQLGVIELKQTCAYVGVCSEVAEVLIEKTNNARLKRTKVKITVL